MKFSKGKARFKVSADGKGIVSHAGTALLRELAAETGLVKGWTAEGVLAEIMLLEGFPLDSRVAELAGMKGNTVRVVTSEHCAHRLLVCLDRQLKDSTVNAFAFQDADVLVCLDAALTDEAKQRLSDLCTLKAI